MKKKVFKSPIRLIFKFIFSTILLFMGFVLLITAFASAGARQVASVGESLNIFKVDEREIDELASSNGITKAKYVGVDDKHTDFSRDIISMINKKYSSSYTPFNDGYNGFCEKWCQDIYRGSGHAYNGSCCAFTHGKRYGKREGKIPRGAVIFSGKKPDGTYFNYTAFTCPVCYNQPGHVAIYIGDGKVAGSQAPFIMDINRWIEIYGYGGWSQI